MGMWKRAEACSTYHMYGQSRSDKPYTQTVLHLEARTVPAIMPDWIGYRSSD